MVTRGFLAAALALIVLCVDFFIFRDLVEDRVAVRAVFPTDVLSGEVITLGKFRLHTLRVSYGRLIDEDYVRSLGPRVNGLAVSAYAATATAGIRIGALRDDDKSIMSARESIRLLEFAQQSPSLPPGKVQVFNPNKDEAGSLAGIKTILVMRAKEGGDRAAKDALREGLANLLDEAGRQSVSGLLLPALTVGIAEKDTPTFNDFFGSLFEALAKSATPRQIDLTLYAGWPTADLESAVRALSENWDAQIRDRVGHLPTLHRLQLRLVLIGLAICFIVSSRHIVLGIKTTLILTIGFALSLLGSFKSVETVTDRLGSDTRTVALIAFALILAIGFPYFVHWSVKDLFKDRTNGAQ